MNRSNKIAISTIIAGNDKRIIILVKPPTNNPTVNKSAPNKIARTISIQQVFFSFLQGFGSLLQLQ